MPLLCAAAETPVWYIGKVDSCQPSSPWSKNRHFTTGAGVAPAACLRLAAGIRHHVGDLPGELDALAQPVIHVELRELASR